MNKTVALRLRAKVFQKIIGPFLASFSPYICANQYAKCYVCGLISEQVSKRASGQVRQKLCPTPKTYNCYNNDSAGYPNFGQKKDEAQCFVFLPNGLNLFITQSVDQCPCQEWQRCLSLMGINGTEE